VKVGEEATEALEVVPILFYVKRYIRPRYARSNGEGILIGILSDRELKKGILPEYLIAEMTVDNTFTGCRSIDR